jgi:outer membrane receptor for ferrienterochelin and colicins
MKYAIIIMLLALYSSADAQEKRTISVKDSKTKMPLEFVVISSDNNAAGTTDSLGKAIVSLVPGPHKLGFFLTGYHKKDTTIDFATSRAIGILLDEEEKGLEEVTIVASTRNGQAIESSPLKVEVLGKEELSEEASIRPGNIASILGDVSGVQIQQSSATSGNSNVRIQGLDGRYTQILRDGMPLYDGFSGGLGILSIPPLDLMQIELIKGSASTLYGGGAIGGLINLISRRPTFNQELDVLANYTTLKELNTNVFASRRYKKLGYTLFAGYTTQQAVDVNGDGFSDVPNASSFNIHPRLSYYPSQNTIITLGYNGSFDQRDGGDMRVLSDAPGITHQYHENNTSQRHTGEYIMEHFAGKNKFTLKGSVSDFDRTITTNTYQTRGNQLSYYGEASLFAPLGKHDLVAGINVVGDDYYTKYPSYIPLQQFNNLTAGAFTQFDLHLQERTTIETGLRVDQHSRYGTFVLPRIAAFHRFNEQWGARAGFGMGYKTPNPLVQQNIDYPITEILPPGDNVKAEASYGYNAEVNYKKTWGKATVFINQAFFLTRIDNPILFFPLSNGLIMMANASAPTISTGSDTYLKLTLKGWELYGGYTYTDARYTYLSANNFIPLTPRNRWAFVVAKEFDEKWRFGLEGSHTGPQYRYDGTQTPAYFFIATMAQRKVGKHLLLVLNCENLLDYRMSKVESLYTGSMTNPTFKPLWAPIDGRVVNLSVRWKI